MTIVCIASRKHGQKNVQALLERKYLMLIQQTLQLEVNLKSIFDLETKKNCLCGNADDVYIFKNFTIISYFAATKFH